MIKPKVSVIMAEYNTEPNALETSIRSILNQTFKQFELILIDDGTNNNLELLKEKLNDNRIKIVKNAKNSGLVYSLNKAIDEANTEYLVRMDTDDIAEPNRIEKLYDFIIKNEKYSVVGSRAIEFNENKELGIIGESGEVTKKKLMRGKAPIHPTTILKKKDIIEVGKYKNYKRCEDFVLWSELLLNNKRIYVVDDILLRYRVNDSDYNKRKIKNRHDEIKAKKIYYKKMGGNIIDKLFILRSILSGMTPTFLVKLIRRRIEMK